MCLYLYLPSVCSRGCIQEKDRKERRIKSDWVSSCFDIHVRCYGGVSGWREDHFSIQNISLHYLYLVITDPEWCPAHGWKSAFISFSLVWECLLLKCFPFPNSLCFLLWCWVSWWTIFWPLRLPLLWSANGMVKSGMPTNKAAQENVM